MSYKVKHVKFPASVMVLLKNLPIAVSPAVSQALLNARDDDSLLLKALKRRLALPASQEEMMRFAVSQDERMAHVVSDLTSRSQLSGEEITRLAVEAYLYKL